MVLLPLLLLLGAGVDPLKYICFVFLVFCLFVYTTRDYLLPSVDHQSESHCSSFHLSWGPATDQAGKEGGFDGTTSSH